MRKYNWIPDQTDLRDFKYAAISPGAPLPVAKEIAYPPVQNQAQEESCVYNGIPSQIEALYITEGIVPPPMLSRQFGYYNYRKSIGQINQDPGASPRDAIKLVAKDGLCLESLWPYTPADFAVNPPPPCWADALTRRITSYHALKTLDDMLQCINSGFSFGCGIEVYSSFESAKVAHSGTVPLPKSGEKLLGGHYILIGGFNQKTKLFTGMNSWGMGWGKAGFFTLPFAYLTNSKLAGDFWTIRK